MFSCGKVAEISKEDMTQAADELDALADNSILATVIIPDWGRMRDENRACAKKNDND